MRTESVEPILELEGVTKVYPMPGGDVHALRGISMRVDPGEFVSIVGSSGSGKTTLLYVLGLLTGPSSGSYRLRGRGVEEFDDRERSAIRGREVGFVFQSFHLLPQLNVLDNVLLAARYSQNGAAAEIRQTARELIDRVGLSHRIGHRPRELSGGEMQRVAIARALLTNPSLILADEPTGNVDEENGARIFDLLHSLCDEGKTVIMVTHNLALAAKTTRQIHLKNGEVIDATA